MDDSKYIQSTTTLSPNRVVAGESSPALQKHVTAIILRNDLGSRSGGIDPAACYLDVGSSSPGAAQDAKGRVVRPLKGNVSWV